MELRHLRYFVAVADEENVSRAALQLHVSQPALSRQIRDLEEELGLLLLQRSAKSVRLTEAGRVFLQEAKLILERVDAAVKAARSVADGEEKELQVGYAPSLTARFLPSALRALQAEAAGVKVRLHDLSTAEMLSGLRKGRLEIALLVRPTPSMLRGLRFEGLACEPWCLAVAPGHALAKRRNIALEVAAKERFIGYTSREYPEYRELLDKVFAPVKKRPRVVEAHDSVSSLITAVEAGGGVALAPASLACMAGPRLKLLPLVPAPDLLPVGAAWPNTELTSTAERFLQLLRAQSTITSNKG